MISLNLEQIKRIELEIMDVIDDFANKNGLCYTLAGGDINRRSSPSRLYSVG